MPPDAEIVVVGAGIAGAATARAIARRGGEVLLLEQFELGHARGSSHGSSRIFRLNYRDEHFVRLALEADEAWRAIEADRGERLIERVGSLDLGPDAAETARALAACGVGYETLTAEDVSARWPITVEPGETAVFQADGGFFHADSAYRALLDDAVRLGVEVRDRTPIRTLSHRDGKVRLDLDDAHIDARVVVVTAGAWAASLLTAAGITLDVMPTRETVVYIEVPGADRLPPVIDYGRLPEPSDGTIVRPGQASYALAAPGVGLKAGLHYGGPAVDPNDDAGPDERLVAWVARWVASRYDDPGDVIRAETCLYTNTADRGFVLERHGRVVVGSACSGHGFKFAPVVGGRLAELALDAAA